MFALSILFGRINVVIIPNNIHTLPCSLLRHSPDFFLVLWNDIHNIRFEGFGNLLCPLAGVRQKNVLHFQEDVGMFDFLSRAGLSPVLMEFLCSLCKILESDQHIGLTLDVFHFKLKSFNLEKFAVFAFELKSCL